MEKEQVKLFVFAEGEGAYDLLNEGKDMVSEITNRHNEFKDPHMDDIVVTMNKGIQHGW